jgi:hypothetical protein
MGKRARNCLGGSRIGDKTNKDNGGEEIEELSCLHNFVALQKKTQAMTMRLQLFCEIFGELR